MTGTTCKNYYELLEVSRQASTEEIRVAFQRKIAALSGDGNDSGELEDEDGVAPESRALRRVLTAAYTTLSNVEKRAEYNRFLPPPIASWEGSDDSAEDRHWVAKKLLAPRSGSPFAVGHFGVVQDGTPPASAFEFIRPDRFKPGGPIPAHRRGIFGALLGYLPFFRG